MMSDRDSKMVTIVESKWWVHTSVFITCSWGTGETIS